MYYILETHLAYTNNVTGISINVELNSVHQGPVFYSASKLTSGTKTTKTKVEQRGEVFSTSGLGS